MIIRYERHDGASGRRTIEPHQLVTWGRRWYLVAWDRERDDWRTFRVDRIGKVDPTARRFRERPLPAEDMIAYIAHTVSRAGWKHQLRFGRSAGRGRAGTDQSRGRHRRAGRRRAVVLIAGWTTSG